MTIPSFGMHRRSRSTTASWARLPTDLIVRTWPERRNGRRLYHQRDDTVTPPTAAISVRTRRGNRIDGPLRSSHTPVPSGTARRISASRGDGSALGTTSQRSHCTEVGHNTLAWRTSSRPLNRWTSTSTASANRAAGSIEPTRFPARCAISSTARVDGPPAVSWPAMRRSVGSVGIGDDAAHRSRTAPSMRMVVVGRHDDNRTTAVSDHTVTGAAQQGSRAVAGAVRADHDHAGPDALGDSQHTTDSVVVHALPSPRQVGAPDEG